MVPLRRGLLISWAMELALRASAAKEPVAFDVLLLAGGIGKTKCAGLVWLELKDEPAICKGNGSVRGYKVRGDYILRADRVAGGTVSDGSRRLHSGN